MVHHATTSFLNQSLEGYLSTRAGKGKGSGSALSSIPGEVKITMVQNFQRLPKRSVHLIKRKHMFKYTHTRACKHVYIYHPHLGWYNS